MKIIIVK